MDAQKSVSVPVNAAFPRQRLDLKVSAHTYTHTSLTPNQASDSILRTITLIKITFFFPFERAIFMSF